MDFQFAELDVLGWRPREFELLLEFLTFVELALHTTATRLLAA